jgi:hypothetical protein
MVVYEWKEAADAVRRAAFVSEELLNGNATVMLFDVRQVRGVKYLPMPIRKQSYDARRAITESCGS